MIEYAYDGLGSQTSEVWKTGGSTVRTIAFTYDVASQLIDVSDPSGEYDYTYDNLGRVTSEVQGLPVLTANIYYTSTFDKNHNRLTLTSTIGSTADFKNESTYDYLNRLTALSQQGQSGGNAVAEKLVQFAYNAAGQFTQLKRWEDVTGATKHAGTTNFGYDNIGRVTKITHHDQVTGLASGTSWGTGILAGYQYTWDGASRITAINNYVDGSISYSYDNTDQLTAADNPSPIGDESYSYDANGNRTMSGYSTGTNNQTTSDGTYNYTYDDEGNRLTKTNISTSAKEEYTWDHRNRLTQVTYKNSSNVVTATVAYQYDYQNRMVVRTEDTDGPGSNAATDQVFSYLGQGINPLLEFDGSGGSDVSARNLWGPNVDQILAVEKVTTTSSAGNVAWAYSDHLGTPRDLADYNAGTDTVTVSNHRVIDGFGRLTSQTNSGFTIPQQFTGKPFDATTGYGYYLNRWFDATTGKWMSEDPIGFEGGDTNLGRYVANSVVVITDPTGLELPGGDYRIAPVNPSPPDKELIHFLSDWWYYANPFSLQAERNCVDKTDAALRVGTRIGQGMFVVGSLGVVIVKAAVIAGVPTYTITVAKGGHVLYSITVRGQEVFRHLAGLNRIGQIVTSRGTPYYLQRILFQVGGIPIIYPWAALATRGMGGPTPCLSTALWALVRGWFGG